MSLPGFGFAWALTCPAPHVWGALLTVFVALAFPERHQGVIYSSWGSWSPAWVSITCSPALQQGWVSAQGQELTLTHCCPWPQGSGFILFILFFPSGQSLHGVKCSKNLNYILQDNLRKD